MNDAQDIVEEQDLHKNEQLRIRLQTLRTWIHDVDWRGLCQALPEAREWFDEDGVPR